jgi:hypothetical protein
MVPFRIRHPLFVLRPPFPEGIVIGHTREPGPGETLVSYRWRKRCVKMGPVFRRTPGRIPASTSFSMSAFIRQMLSFAGVGSRAEHEAP